MVMQLSADLLFGVDRYDRARRPPREAAVAIFAGGGVRPIPSDRPPTPHPARITSPLPINGVNRLQTKLSDREGHETIQVGLQALPLNQHIEGRPGERQTGMEICPDPMHDLLE